MFAVTNLCLLTLFSPAVTCHTARNKYASRPKSKTRDRNDLNIFIYMYNTTNIYKDNLNMNNDLDKTNETLGQMLPRMLYGNPGYAILNKNPEMLTYQKVDGKDEVIIHSTVGKALQGFKKSKICQETQEVENLLGKFYLNDPNVQVIRSDNITNMNCPPSGGSKSRRRKTHNKRASRSKSKTHRRRRGHMSRH